MEQLVVSTIELAGFFTLLGLAYFIVLEGTGIFDFIVGPLAMIAALGASWLAIEHGLGPVVAVLIGIVLASVLSALAELVVVRPVEARTNGEELPALVALAAMLFFLQEAAGTLFGRSSLPGQLVWQSEPVSVGGALVTSSQIVLVIATVVVFASIALWRRLTPMGRTLKAIGDNGAAARLLGLPVARIRLLASALGGAIAGIAGVVIAPKAGVSFDSGLKWTLWGFLVLVIGGTGSIYGPLVGGVILAALQIWVPYWLGPGWVDYSALIAALLFFGLRPTGIFSRKVRV